MNLVLGKHVTFGLDPICSKLPHLIRHRLASVGHTAAKDQGIFMSIAV
jgi:hypothetical protein